MVASVTHATNGVGTESGDGAVSKTAWEQAHAVSGVALASHAHAGADITSGTVADARIDSAIARDSEVSGAVSTHAGIATAHGTFANASHTHAAGDLPDLDSLTVPSADVSMNTHKITNVTDPGSNQDAATKKYVDDSVAAGVSFATPAVVLGTAAAAGAASSTIRSDSTIVAFDATTPAAIGTAAVGAAAVAARRDHVHATGAGTPSTQALGDAAATGSGPAAAMTDHKHALSATTVAALCAADVTMTTAGTDYDAVSASFGIGTWLIHYKCLVQSSGTPRTFRWKLWDGSTIYDEGEDYIVTTGFRTMLTGFAIVTLGGTTTLKISVQADTNAQVIKRDGGVGTQHQATRISAIKIG